jgi:hypothetical protein
VVQVKELAGTCSNLPAGKLAGSLIAPPLKHWRQAVDYFLWRQKVKKKIIKSISLKYFIVYDF